MIAALPMYLRAETMPAHDALWSLIRDALRDRDLSAPDALSHDAPLHDTWTDPGLILGQSCSLPFRTLLKDQVTLLGAGDYGLPDTAPGHYHSALVIRADDARSDIADFTDGLLAINGADSQSGWCAPCQHVKAKGLRFTRTVETGAHRDSARAVAEGRADMAAIDAVTWRLIRRYDAFASNLRVLARTEPTPGLPFITARHRDPAPIRDAMAEALATLPAPHRETLGLRAVVAVPVTAYTGLPLPPPPPGAA